MSVFVVGIKIKIQKNCIILRTALGPLWHLSSKQNFPTAQLFIVDMPHPQSTGTGVVVDWLHKTTHEIQNQNDKENNIRHHLIF